MKKFTVLFAATVVLSSLLTRNILGSEISHAENRQEFRELTNQIKNYLQDETSYAYPKVKKVGMLAQEKIIDFDAENSTVEYQVTMQLNSAIMNNDHLLSGQLTKTCQTIHVSAKLFQQLQNEQSSSCSIL